MRGARFRAIAHAHLVLHRAGLQRHSIGHGPYRKYGIRLHFFAARLIPSSVAVILGRLLLRVGSPGLRILLAIAVFAGLVGAPGLWHALRRARLVSLVRHALPG